LTEKNTYRLSVGQFTLSTLAVLFLWSGASILALWGIIGLASQNTAAGVSLPMFLMTTTSIVIGLLMLPSVYYGLWRILDRPALDSQVILRRLHVEWWVLALPVVLIFGNLIASYTRIEWIVLPILHPLAIGIPTIWLLFFAIRGLPLGSSQRMWGVFDSGLTLGPFLIFLLEGLAGMIFLLVLVVYLFTQPGMIEKILQISTLLEQGQTPERLLEDLRPFLFQPVVVSGALMFGAVVVPMIEEILKPIGVWFLFGRKLTPAAGFAAGALSGAGYALIESMALSSNGEQWSALVLARTGTSVVHILTAGMTGWALAMAWQKRRYLQLLLVYLCAVVIHGLWNCLTLMYSFNMLGILPGSSSIMVVIRAVGPGAPLALMFLAAGCFIVLVAANRLFRNSINIETNSLEPHGISEDSGRSML
jgi:hypothetical protein